MSIRRRMTLTLMVLSVALLGLAGSALYGYVRKSLTDQFDISLRVKGKLMEELIRENEDGSIAFDFADNELREYDRGAKSAEYFELWTVKGKLIRRSDSLAGVDLEIHPQMPDGPRFVDLVLPDGRLGRAMIQSATAYVETGEDFNQRPIRIHPEVHYILAVAKERESLNHTLSIVKYSGLGAGAILTLAFGALMPWLIQRNLKPLNKIAQKAGSIDAGDLKMRFPTDEMPDELKPICAKLNDSLQRLEAAFLREHRFSANVAHELRTPITELRLLSEVAIKFPRDVAETTRSFQDVLEISMRMEAIVETLLEMIRGESPQKEARVIRVDLHKTIEEAWKSCQSIATARNIELKIRGHGQAMAEPMIFKRVMENLLSNAAEYSPEGSTLEVGIDGHDACALIRIKNPAIGLEEEDLAHLADPFWRKDPARVGSSHAGLGLSLVASYMKRMNGQSAWRLVEQGAFEAVLELPRRVEPNEENNQALSNEKA